MCPVVDLPGVGLLIAPGAAPQTQHGQRVLPQRRAIRPADVRAGPPDRARSECRLDPRTHRVQIDPGGGQRLTTGGAEQPGRLAGPG